MGYASIHGTMPIFFSNNESASSIESLQKILFDGSCTIEVDTHPANRIGNGSGEVIGGNLSLIVDALTTSSEPETSGRILVIEEVDEYFYKLDRMFTQLRRTGKLKGLAGMLIGHMTDIKNPELAFGEGVAQIVMRAVRDYAYPVAFSFPSGHQNPNFAWIHGGKAKLDVSFNLVSFAYPNIYSTSE
jgi:muramoyltetrapeptide carboxypeptidase